MAPGFGDNRESILGDLAILTSDTVFTDELDVKLECTTPDPCSSTGSATTTKGDTIFLNGEGSKDAIQARCEQIHSVLDDTGMSKYDKTKLSGSSKVEVGEKKDCYNNALNAMCAAVEEGILPRGGMTSGSGDTIGSVEPIQTANFNQELGVSIIRHALLQPTRMILTNAGEEVPTIVGTLIVQHGSAEQFSQGYDATKACARGGLLGS